MMIIRGFAAGFLVYGAVCTSVIAGLSDYIDTYKGVMDTSGVTASDVGLTNVEMVDGLKAALDKGTQFAVKKLGKPGGFLDNKKVRILMPESLSWVDTSLRTLGQEELADEFVASMNHAAEQAVPEAADIFSGAIKEMSVADAKAILSGPDDAATRYFRTHTETALTERMRPIVEQSTANAGVTSSYKTMMGAAGGIGSLLPATTTDIDGYITAKTLDGLFLMIAKEERKIRENPAARSSELLQKVFGAYN